MDTLQSPARRPAAQELLTVQEIAARVVAAAVWAPSVHNSQPWWFGVHGSRISLRADPGRQLMVADPSGREMMMSCGAALFTARLALRSLGYIPETRVLPDPAEPLLVAEVGWQRRAAPAGYEKRLFEQVLRRRTHRGGFRPLPLSPRLLAVLREGAERHGARLHVITDAGGRAALAAAVETAERAQRLDSSHVRELAAWVSPPGSGRRDGMPPSSYPARPEPTQPYFPCRDFAHGRGWGLPRFSTAAADRSAGVVCLLTTPDDGPVDWINAGQALQRVLLASTACGVAAALHSQPLVSLAYDVPRIIAALRVGQDPGLEPAPRVLDLYYLTGSGSAVTSTNHEIVMAYMGLTRDEVTAGNRRSDAFGPAGFPNWPEDEQERPTRPSDFSRGHHLAQCGETRQPCSGRD